MTSAVAARHVPWARYALLAIAFSALWLAISLFSASSSASADEHEPGGLLGGVGSVLGGVTSVTGTVGDTLGEVVDTAAEPVSQAVEPVVTVAPEPVTEAVLPVVQTVTDAANGTTSGVNTTVGTLVNGLTGAASDLAAGGTVGALVDPLAGVVDGVAGGLPIVGGIVGDNTVGGILSPVAGLVDDTLGTVVGSAGELPTDGTGILPQLPGIPLLPGDSDAPGDPGVVAPSPSIDSGSAARAAALERTSAAFAPLRAHGSGDAVFAALGSIMPADGGSPPGDVPASPAAPGPAGHTGSGNGASAGGAGASGTSDAAFAALELDALASLVLHSVDDALPSSPVFDTDTTPD